MSIRILILIDMIIEKYGKFLDNKVCAPLFLKSQCTNGCFINIAFLISNLWAYVSVIFYHFILFLMSPMILQARLINGKMSFRRKDLQRGYNA